MLECLNLLLTRHSHSQFILLEYISIVTSVLNIHPQRLWLGIKIYGSIRCAFWTVGVFATASKSHMLIWEYPFKLTITHLRNPIKKSDLSLNYWLAEGLPAVFAAQERPASLNAASPLMVALRMPHRNMATGSMPMSCLTKALSLLRSSATMSGRMWSVFFSRKS